MNPEAKQRLLDGEINLFRCQYCDSEYVISTSLLYHDVENKYCAQFVPFSVAKDTKFLDHLNPGAEMSLDLGSPKDQIPDCFKRVHLVFSMDELVRYVFFRESLAQRRASIKRGKVACFSCGDSVKDGETYFCVSRLHKIKTYANKEKNDETTKIVSSLQMCNGCLARATTEKLVLCYLPLPILNLEKEGFYRFARWQANKSIGWKQMEGRHSCSLCEASIKAGDKYTLIEISEEVQIGEAVKVRETYFLATICEICSQEYAVWL